MAAVVVVDVAVEDAAAAVATAEDIGDGEDLLEDDEEVALLLVEVGKDDECDEEECDEEE